MATGWPPSNLAVKYLHPSDWIQYNWGRIVPHLVDAKAAVLSLKTIPLQRDWVEKMQEIQLKMEVAGTSRIEGADFTENELDEALSFATAPEKLITRSQRQARAAVQTYRWISSLPDDMPITEDLIKDIHRRMVTDCDDDHCAPGKLRSRDENVTFGFPRHRGSDGGPECARTFSELVRALNGPYKAHDSLVQAMALHYHFASMHPFLDGNGRTARALEALLLQRAGLRDTAFIAMSNYYYEEKTMYLSVLSEVRKQGHDLTPFLVFALEGVKVQCERLFSEISIGVKKAIFRNMMYDLFPRLETPRKRVIALRQVEILKILLHESMPIGRLYNRLEASHYGKLKSSIAAFVRDINALMHLGAIQTPNRALEGKPVLLEANLDWPGQVSESEFMARVKSFPKAKSHSFLSFP